MNHLFDSFFSDNLADITQALQRLTEGPHVASLSTAVSRATSRISAMGERSSDEFPIPGNLLKEILKVVYSGASNWSDTYNKFPGIMNKILRPAVINFIKVSLESPWILK